MFVYFLLLHPPPIELKWEYPLHALHKLKKLPTQKACNIGTFHPSKVLKKCNTFKVGSLGTTKNHVCESEAKASQFISLNFLSNQIETHYCFWVDSTLVPPRTKSSRRVLLPGKGFS